jgi:outer membrane lipopolysaccharide assembly protein LptE/RlpB
MAFSAVRISKFCSLGLIYLAIVSGLYACGFQLRGSLNISDEVAPIYIEQNSVFELGQEIRSLLATNNIEVAQVEAQSKSKLVLINENRQRRVLSVDGSGRAKEYLLTYTVNFAIQVEQSDEATDTLSVSRSLLFDPDAVLAATNETEILYRDMRRDIARLILLKLQARARNLSENSSGVRDKPVSDPGLDSTTP